MRHDGATTMPRRGIQVLAAVLKRPFTPFSCGEYQNILYGAVFAQRGEPKTHYFTVFSGGGILTTLY